MASGSATIGASGGTIVAGDVQLEVPAGALAANLEIKINETRDAPPPAFDLSTRIFRFEPHGTVFAKKVTVSFTRPASGRPKIYWSRGYKSPYLPLVTRVEGDRVKADVDHFSWGAFEEAASNVGAGAQDFVNDLQPECSSTSQCPPLNDCTSGKCEPRPPPATPQACTNSATCSAGLVCINLLCVEPQCGNGVGCLSGFECDDGACKSVLLGHACGGACSSDGDCGPRLQCFGGRCLVALDGPFVTRVGDTALFSWAGTVFGPGETAYGAFPRTGGGIALAYGYFISLAGYYQEAVLRIPDRAVTGRVYIGVGTPFDTGPFWESGCAAYTSLSHYVLPTPIDASPKVVSPGTLVEVTGQALEGARVAIETARDAWTEAEVLSSTYERLQFRFPPSVNGGALHMRGPPAEGFPNGNAKTFYEQTFTVVPAISSVSPPAAAPGASVVIRGTKLFTPGGARPSVVLGRSRPTVTAANVVGDEQEVVFVVPNKAVTGELVVITPSGPVTWREPFYVLPVFSGFEPNSGSPGDTVSLLGAGLSPVTAALFGPAATPSADATIVRAEDTRVQVLVPELPPGDYTVRVFTDVGLVDSPSRFAILPPPTAFMHLEPSQGRAEDVVAIVGRGLAGTTSVTFPGASPSPRRMALFFVVDDTRLLVAVPNDVASGVVEVTAPHGVLSAPFGVLEPNTTQPFIAGFEPARGARGSYVQIQGSGFLGADEVRFGVGPSDPGQHALSWRAVRDDLIVARVPSIARTGRISVRKVFNDSWSGADFTVVEWQLPAVSTWAPESGPAGTTVLVNGRDLDSVSEVQLGGNTVPFVAHSDRALTFVANGDPGRRDITFKRAMGGVPYTFGTFTITSGTAAGDGPVIRGYYPAFGPPGIRVWVFGTNLYQHDPNDLEEETTKVYLNGQRTDYYCSPFTCSERLHFTVPQGATTGHIVVQHSYRAAVSTAPFLVTGTPTTSDAPPYVVEIDPSSVSVGGTFSVRGLRLAGTASVVIDTRNGDSTIPTPFAIRSDDELSVTIPLTMPVSDTTFLGGTNVFLPHTVVVRNARGESSSGRIVVLRRPDPTVISIEPATGIPGTVVRVRGTGFSGLTAVAFAGSGGPATVPATFQFVDDGTFLTTVPPAAATGAIKLLAPDFGPTAPRGADTPTFTVIPASTGGGTGTTPRITSFDPQSGSPGTSVAITGSGFDGTTRVAFRGIPAAFTLQGTTQLTATVPYGAATGPISVTNAADTATSATDFTVLPPTLPGITSVTPGNGPAGTEVTIAGTDFAGLVGVAFESAPASIVSATDTQLVVRVPLDAPQGSLNLTVTTAAGSAQTTFTVDAPSGPVIGDVNPDAAKRGETLTFTGAGFVGVTGVYFGVVPADFATTNATSMTVIVPGGLAGNSTPTLTVETPRGTATSLEVFTVLPSPPAITSLSAQAGAPGTEIDVTGTDFIGVSRVMFERPSSAPIPASFVALSATSLRVTVPSIPAGPAELVVETPDGTARTIFAVLSGDPTMFTLTVAKAGTGTGTVTSTNPAGSIDCGDSVVRDPEVENASARQAWL